MIGYSVPRKKKKRKNRRIIVAPAEPEKTEAAIKTSTILQENEDRRNSYVIDGPAEGRIALQLRLHKNNQSFLSKATTY